MYITIIMINGEGEDGAKVGKEFGDSFRVALANAEKDGRRGIIQRARRRWRRGREKLVLLTVEAYKGKQLMMVNMSEVAGC